MKRTCVVAFALALFFAACEDGSDVVGDGGPDGRGQDGSAGTDTRDVGDDIPVDERTDVESRVGTDLVYEAGDTTVDHRDVEDGADGPGDVTGNIDGPGEAAVDATSMDMATEADAGGHHHVGPEGGLLDFGLTTLLVPAGSLSSGRTFTMASYTPVDSTPNRADIFGAIYEFGPDGTTFSVPVALTLPLSGAVPPDKVALIAWLNQPAAQWVPVPSTVEGSSVTGLVTHFTSFAVLLVPKPDVCPYGGECGGQLDGTWHYTAACIKPMSPQTINCGNGMSVLLHQSFNVGGTLAITGNSYSASRMIRITSSVFYTPACLTAFNQAQVVYTDCGAVQTRLRAQRGPSWTCSGTLAQGCSCTSANMIPDMEQGTLSVTGNQVVFTQEDSDPGQPSGFCVSGNSLSIKEANGSVFSAMKMP